MLNDIPPVTHLTKLITNKKTLSTELNTSTKITMNSRTKNTIIPFTHVIKNIKSGPRVNLPTINVHTNVPIIDNKITHYRTLSNKLTNNKYTNNYHKVPQTPIGEIKNMP